LKLIAENRRSVYRIIRESFTQWHGTPGAVRHRARRAAEVGAEAGGGD
jgi:hypothetical protein